MSNVFNVAVAPTEHGYLSIGYTFLSYYLFYPFYCCTVTQDFFYVRVSVSLFLIRDNKNSTIPFIFVKIKCSIM